MGTAKGHKKYLTPEKLWDFFVAYKADVKANPRKKHVFVGKDGDSAYQELERPLTFDGFRNYLYTHGSVKRFDDYYYNNHGDYSDFIDVCGRIRSEIREDQIDGGMTMVYNPSITQRINGLVEKTENKHEISEIIVKHES